MKHYKIKYKIGTSEIDSYTVFCLENELEENLNMILYHIKGFIDWIGEKPEGQRDYYETNRISILKKFGLIEKQEENECKIYERWGY